MLLSTLPSMQCQSLLNMWREVTVTHCQSVYNLVSHFCFWKKKLVIRHEMEDIHTSLRTITMARGLFSIIPLPCIEMVTGGPQWMRECGYTLFLIINLWGVGEAPREESSVQHAVSTGTATSRTSGPRPCGSGNDFSRWDSGRWQSPGVNVKCAHRKFPP